MKQVKLNPSIDKLLNEISKHRKLTEHLNCSKQGVVAELVIALHNKEIKH